MLPNEFIVDSKLSGKTLKNKLEEIGIQTLFRCGDFSTYIIRNNKTVEWAELDWYKANDRYNTLPFLTLNDIRKALKES